jgi:hypothetical protein
MMYHGLPRAASFWSFLLAVDQDLAETTRKNHVPVAVTCTAPTTFESLGALPTRFPSHSASG